MVSDGLPTQMEHKRVDIMEKLRAFLDDEVFFRTMCKLASTRGPLTVFCHGDCWTNNILFKDDAEPNEEASTIVNIYFTKSVHRRIAYQNLYKTKW